MRYRFSTEERRAEAEAETCHNTSRHRACWKAILLGVPVAASTLVEDERHGGLTCPSALAATRF
jgi:hypothetical protein